MRGPAPLSHSDRPPSDKALQLTSNSAFRSRFGSLLAFEVGAGSASEALLAAAERLIRQAAAVASASDMDDRIADRLVTYADALAAVTFVGTSGLSLALADPDVRCSLVQGVPQVVVGNLLFACVASAILVMLRRWEADLRADNQPSEKAAQYSRRLHAARLAVVWLSTAMAVVILFASTGDPTCLV